MPYLQRCLDWWNRFWLPRVCNCEDWYAITHAGYDTSKFSRDAINFVAAINFYRKEVTRNLFLKRKASLKYPKIIPFEKPAIQYVSNDSIVIAIQSQ